MRVRSAIPAGLKTAWHSTEKTPRWAFRAQAAAVVRDCRCYVGIDSGSGTHGVGGWIAGSLQVPAIGLYGTSYIPLPRSIQPANPRATYLETNGPASGILPGRVAEQLTV